jgi:hypothetical protein
MVSRDTGHSRVPEPPASKTGVMREMVKGTALAGSSVIARYRPAASRAAQLSGDFVNGVVKACCFSAADLPPDPRYCRLRLVMLEEFAYAVGNARGRRR